MVDTLIEDMDQLEKKLSGALIIECYCKSSKRIQFPVIPCTYHKLQKFDVETKRLFQ